MGQSRSEVQLPHRRSSAARSPSPPRAKARASSPCVRGNREPNAQTRRRTTGTAGTPGRHTGEAGGRLLQRRGPGCSRSVRPPGTWYDRGQAYAGSFAQWSNQPDTTSRRRCSTREYPRSARTGSTMYERVSPVWHERRSPSPTSRLQTHESRAPSLVPPLGGQRGKAGPAEGRSEFTIAISGFGPRSPTTPDGCRPPGGGARFGRGVTLAACAGDWSEAGKNRGEILQQEASRGPRRERTSPRGVHLRRGTRESRNAPDPLTPPRMALPLPRSLVHDPNVSRRRCGCIVPPGVGARADEPVYLPREAAPPSGQVGPRELRVAPP